MAVVYVIQVMAHHGVGTQGWRTVSRRAGEPYCFGTREAALEVMHTHFANLREGINVRVQALPAAERSTSPVVPSEPDGQGVPCPQHRRDGPS
jgi:hypothetical protein